MNTRIYPVLLKPPSGITNWGQWPEDVEPEIKRLNRAGKLTFAGHQVFKCVGCEQFCRPQTPAAMLRQKGSRWRNIGNICDECLILRVRSQR